MPAAIVRSEEHIFISGALTLSREMRWLCAALFHCVEQEGHGEVILNFAECGAVTEAAMLPLLPILSGYRKSHNVRFRMVEPDDDQLKRLFVNTNWAHFIEPEHYEFRDQSGEQVPAQCFASEADMDPIIAAVAHLLLTSMNIERETLTALEWSMNELMDNVLTHAQSPTGGFVQATAYHTVGRVEFIVADGGIGIAKSMGLFDHERALGSAIAEGRTRDRETNMGNGLYGSFRIATLSRGQFEINSGYGLLYAPEPNLAGPHMAEYTTMNRSIPYNGTAVRCGVGVNDPDLLAKALVFGGRTHEPPYDYVERRYGGEGDEMVFSVKDELGQDLGSRSGGRRARQVVENLLREDREVVLDFSDIPVISSSFADEVLGRLFVQMGPRAFMSRIRIQNANPTIEGLIDRAILQRTRAEPT